MQTHKKWLIITIWIATIAFVGAGFVGWGAYSYGKKDNTIAVIKDTEVTMENWQDSYNKLFQEYNQYFAGKLDDATAKQLGLDKQALKQAINSAILKQFAKDNGIIVTDLDVAKVIANTKYFFKDGKFDNETYKSLLKKQGLNPASYESKVKQDLLIKKIVSAISIEPTKNDIKSIAAAVLLEDDISIKIVDSKNINPTINEKELKSFWEINKEKYKSEVTYDVHYFYSPLSATTTEDELKVFYTENKNNYKDEKGKILSFEKAKENIKKDLIAEKSKSSATDAFISLKNGKSEFKIAKNIKLKNDIITVEFMNKIISTNNKILKPILTEKGYLIAKLSNKNMPTTLEYIDAKELSKIDLTNEKRKLALLEKAQNSLKNFEGKKIGFISRMDSTKLKSLTSDEANEFISQLFDSNTSTGFMLIPEMNPSKAVLYKITEQKLLNESKFKELESSVVETSTNMLDQEIIKQLISKLEKKYEIKTYIKDEN
jgi:peptidyl-prolyl cis-trans isomerase D